MFWQYGRAAIDCQQPETFPGKVGGIVIKTPGANLVEFYKRFGVKLGTGTAKSSFGNMLNTKISILQLLIKAV